MHTSIFTLGHPVEAYDLLYNIYVYCLAVQLAFSFTALAYIDMAEQKPDRAYLWGVGILLLPLVGAAVYLLTRSDTDKARARLALIVTGFAIWAVALAIGLPKIWGPLGPKAL